MTASAARTRKPLRFQTDPLPDINAIRQATDFAVGDGQALLQELVRAIIENRAHPLLRGWKPDRPSLRELRAREHLLVARHRLKTLGVPAMQAWRLVAETATANGAWRTFPPHASKGRARGDDVGMATVEQVRAWEQERGGNTVGGVHARSSQKVAAAIQKVMTGEDTVLGLIRGLAKRLRLVASEGPGYDEDWGNSEDE